MKDNKLNTSIEFVKGVGKIRAKILKEELGVKNCFDLLNFYPNKYLDRSRFYKINELSDTNIYVQIIGVFKNITYKKSGNKYRIEGLFFDGDSNIKVIWFKGLSWVEKSISLNSKYVLFGKLNWFEKKPSFVHPDFEKYENFKNKAIKLQPVYSSTEKLSNSGISNKYFIKIIKSLFDFLDNQFDENLNETINKKYNLISPRQSFYNIHFPSDYDSLEKARFRLK